MWTIIFLTASLAVVQGTSLDEIYGSYVPVLFAPHTAFIPYCIRYEISKDIGNIQCTCADGKNTTLVELKLVEVSYPDGPRPVFQPPFSIPILAVNTVEEINQSLNVSCNCAGKDFRTRNVVRKVNKNYILLYAVEYGVSYYNDDEKNSVQLLAQNLPSHEQLLKDVGLIEELKHRSVVTICSKDAYEEWNKKKKTLPEQ